MGKTLNRIGLASAVVIAAGFMLCKIRPRWCPAIWALEVASPIPPIP